MTTASIPSVESTAIAIPIRQIGADLAIYISDAEVLVSSKSQRNAFRLVDLTADTSTCPAGAHGLPRCHHRTTAKIAAEIERAEARPLQPAVLERILDDVERVPVPMKTRGISTTPAVVNRGYCTECDCEKQMPGSDLCRYCGERKARREIRGLR